MTGIQDDLATLRHLIRSMGNDTTPEDYDDAEAALARVEDEIARLEQRFVEAERSWKCRLRNESDECERAEAAEAEVARLKDVMSDTVRIIDRYDAVLDAHPTEPEQLLWSVRSRFRALLADDGAA